MRRINNIIKRAGIPILLNFSMPPDTPLISIIAFIAIKTNAAIIAIQGKKVVSVAAL